MIVLIFYFKNIKIQKKGIQTSKNDIDMKTIVDSIFKTQNLYKNLKKRFHPDRFPNHQHKEELNSLYQEMEINKADYKELLLIESKIETLLRNSL